MFAHQIHAMGEQFERVEGAAPFPGSKAGMGGFAEELHLDLIYGR